MGNVSPQNPCPFLRALTAGGFIAPDTEPVGRLAQLIAEAAGGSTAERRSMRLASVAIAAIANGLRPRDMLRNITRGLRVDALRGGPLDKRGAGSRILDQHGEIEPSELDRLDTFAVDCQRPEGGGTERGLRLAQLRTMMDANFERAAGARRAIDRRLMNGEWPVLLRVLGKGNADDAYLSVDEVRTLFVERKLPARIVERIAQFARSPASAG